jgi:hypothetical protein
VKSAASLISLGSSGIKNVTGGFSFLAPFIFRDAKAISSSFSVGLGFGAIVASCCFDLLVKTASSLRSLVLTEITS